MHWIKEEKEVLAACDEELLGKKLKKGKKKIEIKEDFYKGRKVKSKELQKLIKEYGNINLVGEKTVETAKKERGNIQVKKIQGIPHALIFTINK